MGIESLRVGRRLWPLAAVAFTLVALEAVILAPSHHALAQDQQPPPKEKTLYQRMGGYDVIAGLVEDFVHQLGEDPAFKRFGGGRGMDSLHRTRQLVVDQLCNLAGGPCVYIGRDNKTAHAGLAITQEEWDSSMKKWKASLDKFKIAEPEQKDFLAMIEKTRPDIVEKPKGDYPQADKTKTPN